MTCAACGAEMEAETFEGHLGPDVTVDFCRSCQMFWFDRYESLQLPPRSTLKVFKIIGDAAAAGRPSAWLKAACPRCGIRLLRTHDLQRNTPFEYWRCPKGHGRLISFYDFLREKDFIRPLSAAQIAELRKRIDSVNCSNCGAPVDLGRHTSCPHCGSPLSLLDLDRASQLIAQLQRADQPMAAPDAGPPPIPAPVDTAGMWPAAPKPPDLIGDALRSLLSLLKTHVR